MLHLFLLHQTGCPGSVHLSSCRGGFYGESGRLTLKLFPCCAAEPPCASIIFAATDIRISALPANERNGSCPRLLMSCHSITTEFGCSSRKLTRNELFGSTACASLIAPTEIE